MYQDVIGLCKLATPDDIKEQEYTLNPGRYVGVVIEEDGKTEEEFISDLLKLNDQFAALNHHSAEIQTTISANLKAITGES